MNQTLYGVNPPTYITETPAQIHHTSQSPKNNLLLLEFFLSIMVRIIVSLLTLRGILGILTADPTQSFAKAVYFITNPLVAPFKGSFSYENDIFQVYTGVAIITYLLMGFVVLSILKTVRTIHTTHINKEHA